MKTILSLILAVLATATTMAQSITGKVVDETNSPLDFVNVVLLKADSTYIAGTVTDEMVFSCSMRNWITPNT